MRLLCPSPVARKSRALSMSFKILTLNNISVRGLERLPRDRYEVASEIRPSGRGPGALGRHASAWSFPPA